LHVHQSVRGLVTGHGFVIGLELRYFSDGERFDEEYLEIVELSQIVHILSNHLLTQFCNALEDRLSVRRCERIVLNVEVIVVEVEVKRLNLISS
jgi:hypothetical protein